MELTLTDTSRIRWACRRGMRELDVLFEPFLDERFPHLSDSDRSTFIALLENTDQDLWSWFFTDAKPEDLKLKAMVKMVSRVNVI